MAPTEREGSAIDPLIQDQMFGNELGAGEAIAAGIPRGEL